MQIRFFSVLAVSLLSTFSVLALTTMPGLKVSANHRFLVYDNGMPFFYLGDTAWELFHRLNREDAARYLENRAHQGFTVIQCVFSNEGGPGQTNTYGCTPSRSSTSI